MRRNGIRALQSLVIWLIASLAWAQLANAQSSRREAANLGPEDPDKQISVTVWLNLHNKTELDAFVQGMYDKTSANYHKFLTVEQFNAQYGPTAEDAAVVRDFLASHNMKVTSIHPNNRYVVAQGRVGDAQAAFNVQINRTMVKGAMHRAVTSPVFVSGPAAAVVSTVQGLSDLKYQANVIKAVDPETGQPYASVPPSAVGADGLFFSGQCLRPPETVNFTTGGNFPKATYTGNRYGADITSQAPNLPPCGYDSAELQQAYGLNPLYQQGLNGKGQTIVIVDAFGSDTILADANLFSSLNGLPQLTSSNFQIVGTTTCGTDKADCLGGNWNTETTLDVEWAHSIAPGAKIVLVVGADASFANLDAANLAAVEGHFGNVISNSFGIQEIALVDLDPAELPIENGIAEEAAAVGISQNVSSGDSGDELATDNADFGINAVSVNANADSPFVTAVGGTSTFLDSRSNIELQTGWGLNLTRIAGPTPNPPTVPPLSFGFQFGSGGGTSVVYAKPKFQEELLGKFRLVPDISMDADPETGVEVIITPSDVPGAGQAVGVVGGTSLSCPMFSAFWAIANQAAGGGPLGQAAPTLYKLPEGPFGTPIIDVNVQPINTVLNVFGTILDPPSSPVLFETPAALAQPLENTIFFVSALFQSPTSTRWDVFTFGTDSSLFTAPGWDNVTGLGTPNGAAFIDSVLLAVH